MPSAAVVYGYGRALLGPATVAATACVAATVVALVDPSEPGHYPTCPVLALTGYFCPGCGSARAVHALTHLDLAAAWDMNPLLVLMLPYLLGSWIAWTRRSATGRPRAWLAPAWVLYSLFAVVVAYAVARNVPALAPWLAP